MNIDNAGDIVFAGSGETGASRNYAIVKLDSAGNERWSARFDGPAQDADAASALAIGGQNEIYVTGYSYHSHALSEIATVKLSAAGVQEWAARFAGPAAGSGTGVA